MNVSRYTRAGGVVGHLLLVAMLVCGIFAMHTLGHPTETSEPKAPAAAHMPGMGAMPEHAAETGTHRMSHAAPAPDHGPELTASAPTPDEPGTGMDMTTLCLAVLSTWAAVVLLRVILGRRRGRPVNLVADAVAALRPNPPPPRSPDLAMLSILRI